MLAAAAGRGGTTAESRQGGAVQVGDIIFRDGNYLSRSPTVGSNHVWRCPRVFHPVGKACSTQGGGLMDLIASWSCLRCTGCCLIATTSPWEQPTLLGTVIGTILAETAPTVGAASA